MSIWDLRVASVKTRFTISYQSGSFDGFNPQSFTKYLRLTLVLFSKILTKFLFNPKTGH